MPAPAFRLRILPAGRQLELQPSLTLLQSALHAGVHLPSSCRNGTCRTCLCRLVEGSVAYTVEWPGLSADERAEGFILPCVALPLSDVTIESDWARWTNG